MKLRIHGNALRLRLSQSEVARFAEQGRIEETVEFGPGMRMAYTLESSDVQSPQAVYRDGSLRIQVPRATSEEWVTSDRVGFSGGEPVSITVEKDFQCLHGPDSRNPDAFPNPLAEGTAKHHLPPTS
jgi:uncharacterized protein DUF7009